MATTMTLIAKQTVGSGGAASVTFSNIPDGYTDLQVVASIRSNRSAAIDSLKLNFNGSITNYSGITVGGTGSSAFSENNNDQFGQPNPFINSYAIVGNSATSNTFSNVSFYITNYRSSNNKSVSIDYVNENNATSTYEGIVAGLWSNTAAITSISFAPFYGTAFTEFSTFYLYGISSDVTTQNTTVPYATGGDNIYTDGTYWYHTFLYSGTFTPLKELTCDYLVVAGGGGGGGGPQPGAGGGGAGGYRTSIGGTALTLTANTAYAATVGAGGTGGTSSSGSATGVQGGSSIFSTITSAGGGGGAGSINTDTVTSGSGGSGGGGARPQSSPSSMAGGAGNTPSVSPSQGNNGGSGFHNPGVASLGGGGGGASAVGGNAGGSTAGAGGAGTANSISGSSITYAGGGGGGADTGNNGAGGAGGGGAGGNPPTAGTANRGGGGGGSGNYNTAGANGSSGIIVLRYAVA